MVFQLKRFMRLNFKGLNQTQEVPLLWICWKCGCSTQGDVSGNLGPKSSIEGCILLGKNKMMRTRPAASFTRGIGINEFSPSLTTVRSNILAVTFFGSKELNCVEKIWPPNELSPQLEVKETLTSGRHR